MKALIVEFITPLPSPRRFVTAVAIGLTVLAITIPILVFNEPAMVTSSYEVLEPETWVGKELPILEHIDIAESLKKGTWLLLLYHYDCPDCGTAIPKYEQMARDLAGNEDFLQIALIEVPPYGRGPISINSPCILGKLDKNKKWFVKTPVLILLSNSVGLKVWKERTLNEDTITRFLLNAGGLIRKSLIELSCPTWQERRCFMI